MSRRRHAFTLVELLIVIGIIAILIAISVTVGNAVLGGGRERATQDTIRVLDTALDAYIQAKESLPDTTVADPRFVPPAAPTPVPVLPVADARDMESTDNPVINSVGLVMLQLRSVPQARAALDSLPSRFARDFDPDGAPAGDSTRQPTLFTAFDAWGRPIRFVHPAFDGVLTDQPTAANPNPNTARDLDAILGPASPRQTYRIARIRRNAVTVGATPGDSDGGLCPGNRPYFYSAGADGDPAARGDNVYTTQPNFGDQ